jgi:hypothetical protein
MESDTSRSATASAPEGDAAPAPPPSDDAGVVLPYATPWPRRKYVPSVEANRMFWLGVRKIVFAGGLGLIAWGLTSLYGDVNRHAAPVAVGWGIFFVILMLRLDFPRLPRRRDKRRQGRRRSSRRASARAAFGRDFGIHRPCGSSASTPACDSPATV